ncbi:MAG: LamG-like jellyroll fold domain-containing protein, partial [Chthoniobacteraceae bacterium]
RGSYVELPSGIFNHLTNATVEGWVKWEQLASFSRFFDFGRQARSINVRVLESDGLGAGLYTAALQGVFPNKKGVLRPNEWRHVALVMDGAEIRLFLDGNMVASGRSGETFASINAGEHNYLGRSNWEADPLLRGGIDEFRVWQVARSAEQIRENLAKKLTGSEPGVVGLWNFDDPANPGRDASPNHHDGKLMGNARVVAASAGGSVGVTATVSGRITDAAGKPVRGAEVRVLQGGSAVGTAKAGEGGDYFLLFSRKPGSYRVLASLENLEAESAETEFVAGGNKLDVTLRDTLSISGILAGPDGQPRRGVKVEAVSADGAVAKFSVSDAKGKFILRRLPDGEFKLRAGGVELDDGEVFAVSADAPLFDLKLTLPAVAAPERPPTENRVLALDGSGAHLNLPTGMFGNLRETTIEAWVRFDALTVYQRFFGYGVMGDDLYLGKMTSADLAFGTFHRPNSNGRGFEFQASGVLVKGRWCHVAAVIDARETRLYLNGTLAASAPKASSFADLPANLPAYIGRWSNAGSGFTGGIDEVRVWAAARTGEAIRASMFQRLSGREEGLAGLWNFDDPEKPGRDATPNGFDGEMVQNAAAQPEALPAAAADVAQWASLSGVTVDVDGRPLAKVKVRAERGEEHFDAESDDLGNFSLLVPGSSEAWRVTATRGDLSATPASLELEAGEHPLTLILRDAAPLSGHVRAPDGSPLPTVVVQALPIIEEGKPTMVPGLAAEIFNVEKAITAFPVIAEGTAPTVQRTDPGVDFPLQSKSISGGDAKVTTRFFARWKGRIRIRKGGEYAFHLAANDAARLTIDGRELVESIWRKVAGGLSQTAPLVDAYKTGAVTLEAGDHELLLEYYNDTGREGVRLAWSFDGGEKAVVPPEVLFHERAKPGPLTVMSDARGRFRFPSAPPGRYTLRAHVRGGFAEWENGREVTVEADKQLTNLDFALTPFKQGRWKTYTHENGLAGDAVVCVFQAKDGAMWFGTDQGVSRFDGRTFSSLPAEDGMPRGPIRRIEEDDAGRMWMGGPTGLVRYDPKASSPRAR